MASRSEIKPSAPLFASRAAIEVMFPSLTSFAVSTMSRSVPAALENSEVLPLGSVAVAVMYSPADTAAASVTLKTALPLPLVSTDVEPR